MPTERYGEYEFYYPQLGLTVELPYEIDIGRGDPGEPHHDADRAVAIVYQHGTVTPENELATFELARHRGEHLFELDLGRYGVEHSPLMVQFVIERLHIEGPRRGMTEVQDQKIFGVVLAQPAVAEVKASSRMLPAGETTTLSVARWGALVYDSPGLPPRLESYLPIFPRRFPPEAQPRHVTWTVTREFQEPTECGSGPQITHTETQEDQFTPLTFRASLSDQPDPPGVRVIGSSISLRLSFLDPTNTPRAFPSQIPVAVVYEDGTRLATTLQAGGRLLLEVDRKHQAFTLAFNHQQPAYLASREGEPDRSATWEDVDRFVADGWSVFGLPFGGTFRSMDWEAQGDAALDPTTRRFESLDDPERFFGTDVSPLELTLDPRWIFLRFEYTDRLYGLTHHDGARVGVPNLLLKGTRHSPSGSRPEDWDTLAAWPVLAGDRDASCQALPWIRTRSEDGTPLGPLDPEAVLIAFEAPETYVKTESPFDRHLVRLDPSAPSLARGAPRLDLYDLPELWCSRHQLVRGPDRVPGKLDAKALERARSADAPLLYCLDDLVLVDESGSPSLRDVGEDGAERDLSPETKITLLGFDPTDGFRLRVYLPRADAPQFSDWPFAKNVIVDCPPQVRAVLFCGELYPIAHRRTREGACDLAQGHLLGARAARRRDPQVSASERFRGLGPYSRHEIAAFDLHYLHAAAMHHDRETVVSGLVRSTSILLTPDLDRGARPGDAERWLREGVARIAARWSGAGIRYEPSGDFPLMVQPLTLVEADRSSDAFDPNAVQRRHLVHARLVDDAHELRLVPGALTLRRSDCDDHDRPRGRVRPAPPSKDGSILPAAHVVGHLFGLADEQPALLPGWGLPGFEQPAECMPFVTDAASVMVGDRAARARHHLTPATWLNTEVLERFLPGVRVRLQSGTRTIDPSADPWAPEHRGENVPLGDTRCDLYLVRLDAEQAKLQGLSGVLVLRLLIRVVFRDAQAPWEERWKREWLTALNRDLRLQLDDRFSLDVAQPTAGRVRLVFEPRYDIADGPSPLVPHAELAVSLGDAKLEREADTIRCGADAEPLGIARMLLGLSPGSAALTAGALAPLATWASEHLGADVQLREVTA